MTSLKELETRIIMLEDIEEIKKLKGKYWRCLGGQLWDELADCFSEDAIADYGNVVRCEGRDAVMDFFRTNSRAARNSVIRIFHGHTPEIEITSSKTATGIWQFYHYGINTGENVGYRHGAFYYDDYIKVNNEWKIKSTTTKHVFREEWDREGMRLV